MKNSKKIGRDKSRTHDLSHAKGTRYQLRHTPIFEFEIFGNIKSLNLDCFFYFKIDF